MVWLKCPGVQRDLLEVIAFRYSGVHEMPENRIYKIEDSGVGAEIILQIDHVMRSLQLSLFPPMLVGLEKTGAGQTKGVDTLFDIPNQKTVSLKRILADGTQIQSWAPYPGIHRHKPEW